MESTRDLADGLNRLSITNTTDTTWDQLGEKEGRDALGEVLAAIQTKIQTRLQRFLFRRQHGPARAGGKVGMNCRGSKS